MEKLSKPINVAVDGSILSFDEPRDSFQYDIYVDDIKVTTIDSERRPNFIGATPNIGRYYDTVVVHLEFDVPISALDIEYSLDYQTWLHYNDKQGIKLVPRYTEDPYSIWFRGYYIATGAPIENAGHIGGYTVLKGYPITYIGSSSGGQYAYLEPQPDKAYVSEETKIFVQANKIGNDIYGFTGVTCTNCQYSFAIADDTQYMEITITKPTGNITVTPQFQRIGFDEVTFVLSHCKVSPAKQYSVQYQEFVTTIIPDDGYELPTTTGSGTTVYIGVTYEADDAVFNYNAVTGVISVVPVDGAITIKATCVAKSEV